MQFLWLDRVVKLHCAKSIVTALDIPRDEALFVHHFPLRPMFPASLLFESVAQAGTALIESSLGFTRKALPGYIAAAKFYRAIGPGDSLMVALEAESWGEDAAVLAGDVRRGADRCASFRFGMFTAPLDEFYGPDHAAHYRAMYTEWLTAAEVTGFTVHPLEELAHAFAG